MTRCRTWLSRRTSLRALSAERRRSFARRPPRSHQHRAARHAVLRAGDDVRHAGPVVLDINRYSLDAVRRPGLPRSTCRSGVRRRWTHGTAASIERVRSTSDSWRPHATARSSSSPVPGDAVGVATDLRFFSWHRPILTSGLDVLHGRRQVRRSRRHPDPAERAPQRRALLRMGEAGRGHRQRVRRRHRDIGRSIRSCPASTS